LPFTSRPFAGRRRRWFAAPPLWSLLALLVLAGIGTAVAVAVTRNQEEQTLTATAPPARAPAPTTTIPEPTTAPATTPPAPAAPPPTTPVQERPIDWPDQDGYTIVLESIPTSSSRQRALQTARRAIRQGLRDVGVLASSNYPSLQPGYYVVFAGIYESIADAVEALPEANDAGFEAYVRPVSG
jgi:cell division septation protein DedD